MLRILVACEYSGRVRNAFRALGHDAWSCDLLPSEDDSLYHSQQDCFKVIDGADWDLVIAHPPCTHLSSSGARHWAAKAADGRQQEAVDFFMHFTDLDCAWAIENPIGLMSSRYRKPDQIIQPWQFGHDASKSTCLWLNGLPPLVPTNVVQGRAVGGLARWSNQTDSGQNRLSPSPDRWKERSRTFQGIADAMASQWSAALTLPTLSLKG